MEDKELARLSSCTPYTAKKPRANHSQDPHNREVKKKSPKRG